MPFAREAHHRRSIRLPAHDYASAGAYFITIVTKERECLFDDDALRRAVDDAWHLLAQHNPNIRLDTYVVMPNHIHGILFIDGPRRGGSRTAPTGAPVKTKPLGRLVGSFKVMSTKAVNILRDTPGVPLWQRNYYERIIRNTAELARIRQYIRDNPANWATDPENPRVAGAQTHP
jgi:REP element-mobilizing transposase RayT